MAKRQITTEEMTRRFAKAAAWQPEKPSDEQRKERTLDDVLVAWIDSIRDRKPFAVQITEKVGEVEYTTRIEFAHAETQ